MIGLPNIMFCFINQHLTNTLSLIISFFQTWNTIDVNNNYKWTSWSFEAFTKVKSIILITIYSIKPILSFSVLHSILLFIQLLMSLLIIFATYTKAIEWTNKWQNFIAIPSWKMNKTFKLFTKHDMLENKLYVFIGHALALQTQGIWNHYHQI
jgi:hypothetical protein